MLKFSDSAVPSTPENDPAADFDDEWLNVGDVYCTDHEVRDDGILATYFAHGRWRLSKVSDHAYDIMKPRTVDNVTLIEALIKHLADDDRPLTQEQVDATRSLAALGAPVEALSLLMEFDRRPTPRA